MPMTSKTPPGRWPSRVASLSVRARVIGAFGLLVLILLAIAFASAWELRSYRGQEEHAEEHSSAALKLEDAWANTAVSGLLVERYLDTENEQLVAAIRLTVAAADRSLAAARDHLRAEESASADAVTPLLPVPQRLSETTEEVIALQQAGQADAARAAWESLVAELTPLGFAFADAVAFQSEAAASVQAQADSEGGLAFKLFVVSGVLAGALALSVSVLIARSIIRPLSRLESTALAVAGGDLDARAPAGGPSELASLGRSLNRMTDSLLDASKRRELERERERAFEELARNEEQFRTLAHASAAIIFRTDPHGACSYVNERWKDITGRPQDAALGRGWATALHPDDRNRVFQEWTETVTQRRMWKAQFRFLKPDGGVTWVEAQAMPQLRDGALLGYVGTVLDITDRKQAEDDLRRLNQELAQESAEIEELNRSLELKVHQRTKELERANAALRERYRELTDARAQAATDGLTGLLNHRSFQEHLRTEVEAAEGAGQALGLIMLDIDGFKRINDAEGHLVGDQILRDLAETLARLDDQARPFRYGGDEFALLLPRADRTQTLRLAERLRGSIAARGQAAARPVTVSLGVASFPAGARTAEELLYGADAAMYWAKSAGKDRVGDWSELVRSRDDESQPWYVSDPAVRTPDAVSALVAALTAKDPSTSAHTDRCSFFSGRLAQALGLSAEESSIVRLASLLHDVGKIAVPDEVLFKPGPLNEDEWAKIKQHPTAALHVLREIRAIHDATPAVLHHHEHFDGSGYPDGLAGDEIPLASRILLVTDAFDAMTSDRPYRKAMPVEHAIQELERNAGTQFDPRVVEAFLEILAGEGVDRQSPEKQPGHSAARR
jgi:diguanylate cyclase (GGDEF)-like protein/PAS domain S-box-containing protein